MAKKELIPNRSYNFGAMKKGDIQNIRVTRDDPIAGSRARTAAYAFTRRHNEKVKRTKKGRAIKFVGRMATSGKVMQIRRVL